MNNEQSPKTEKDYIVIGIPMDPGLRPMVMGNFKNDYAKAKSFIDSLHAGRGADNYFFSIQECPVY